MKLNTLLLTSAATLMATSVAFAADLPSKKAAPAAGSVQVCKVGGMTGFTLPGSDTCFSISGRVTVDFQNNNNDDDFFDNGTVLGDDGDIGFRLNLDARSNTEIGIVRSFIRLTEEGLSNGDSESDAEVDKAYIQFAAAGGNLTVGLKDSIADIAGTQGELFGSGWSQPAQGIDYQVKLGGLNLGIELGDSLSGGGGDQPDLIGHISGSAGGVGFAFAAAMTDDGVESGTALMASANIAAGPAKFFAWGGIADGADASAYITSIDNLNDVVTYGAGVTFTVSSATSISVQGVHWEDDVGSLDLNSYSVFLSHALAKNLYIQPEVLVTDGLVPVGTDPDNVVGYMLRIKRDF